MEKPKALKIPKAPSALKGLRAPKGLKPLKPLKQKKARFKRIWLRQGGDYLLSRFRSTIGVTRFNFSVRNGKRWSPCAVIT